MFAFLFRFAGCLVLAAGAAFATGDIARSLAAEAVRLTSVSEAMMLLSGGGTEAGDPTGASSILALIGEWPVSPTLAAIAVVLILIGRRRPQPAFRH
jgi:hypothetical protein